jgi:hypothetical protein
LSHTSRITSACAEVLVDQPLDLVGPVLPRAADAGLDPPPPQVRGEEHEQRPHPAALVVVILAFGRAGRHRQRFDGVPQQLLGRLVHAHLRPRLVRRQGVDVQHLLHLRHEPGGVAFGDAPALHAPGLQLVFFSALRTVSLQTCVTTLRPTSSSASSRIVQRARPAGAGAQQLAASVASARLSITGATGGGARGLR